MFFFFNNFFTHQMRFRIHSLGFKLIYLYSSKILRVDFNTFLLTLFVFSHNQQFFGFTELIKNLLPEKNFRAAQDYIWLEENEIFKFCLGYYLVMQIEICRRMHAVQV